MAKRAARSARHGATPAIEARIRDEVGAIAVVAFALLSAVALGFDQGALLHWWRSLLFDLLGWAAFGVPLVLAAVALELWFGFIRRETVFPILGGIVIVVATPRDLGQRPLHVGDGVAFVVATHAIPELDGGQSGVATDLVQVEQEGVHAQRRGVDPRCPAGAGAAAAVCQQGDPAHRATRGQGHKRGRRAVGCRHGRCDAIDSSLRAYWIDSTCKGGGQTPGSCVRWM